MVKLPKTLRTINQVFYRSFVVFLEAIPHPQLIVSSLCGLLESFFALIGAPLSVFFWPTTHLTNIIDGVYNDVAESIIVQTLLL